MQSAFSPLDWLIFGIYFFVLTVTSVMLSRTKIDSSRDFFITKHHMSTFAVAISVIATSQSAATFLGAPEFSYKYNFTFIGFYLSAVVGAFFVAFVLIPKFYEMRAVTVYELLEIRYGESAKKQAGVMFLLGRVLASGARLYIGALAISMILFNDITFSHVSISIAILIVASVSYAYFGGIRSIILSDIIQAATYVSASLFVLVFLYNSLESVDIFKILKEHNKLLFIDTSLSGEFNIFALLSGWLLLNIAAYGLDQDLTQRILCCKDKKEAVKSLFISTLLTLPIVMIFLTIGALLYVFYLQSEVVQSFQGEKITIFMYYILNEMPEGLRAIVTIGAVATALSSTNSVLGAMASVAIEDLYRPWKTKKGKTDEKHFIKASRIAVLFFAFALSLMAILSYFWQQYGNLSLISFALGVMAFAYAGLLGVYFSAIFTKRGNKNSVLWAFIGGFITVLALQPYTFGINLGFSWQITAGTVVAFLITQTGAKHE